MDSILWAFLLLIGGIALLFIEVFIPSGGLLLIMSLVCLGGAFWSAWQAWWFSAPWMFWSFVVGTLCLIPVVLRGAFSLWPYTPLGRMSQPPSEEDVTPYIEEQRRLEKMIGEEGETVTPLNPAGMLSIQNQRIHCQSEGVIVPRGTRVKVLSVKGNHLVVRAVSSEKDPSTTSNFGANDLPQAPDSGLDFELPSS